MKRLILLLSVLCFGLSIFAQNSSTYDATFKSSETYLVVDKTGSTADTIGANDSTWTYTTRLYTPSKLFYDMHVALDSIDGTSATTIIRLNARDMSVDDWTVIDSAVWTTGADTIINFEQFTTAQPYKDYQVSVTGGTDSFTVRVTRFIQRFLND